MRVARTRFLLIAVLSAAASQAAPAQYPTIASLDRTDPLFIQHQSGVAEYHRLTSAGNALPALLLYTYEVQPGDTIFGLAALFLGTETLPEPFPLPALDPTPDLSTCLR